MKHYRVRSWDEDVGRFVHSNRIAPRGWGIPKRARSLAEHWSRRYGHAEVFLVRPNGRVLLVAAWHHGEHQPTAWPGRSK